MEVIEKWLSIKRGQKVVIKQPKKGEKEKLVELAAKNAQNHLEQNKEKYSGQICETPIDYLRAKQQQEDKITLYRVTIENGNLKIMTDEP